MLTQVHKDALWMLENLGVGCKQPDMQDAFRKFESQGEAIIYEDRIYLTNSLVERCLSTTPVAPQSQRSHGLWRRPRI